MNNTVSPRLITLIIALVLLSFLFSLFLGATSSNDAQFVTILLQLRLPRALTAFVSGALLALAGSLMQLLLYNPLADPYALGVSGGAAFCTLLLMWFGVNEIWLTGGAWVGSLATMLFMLLLAKKHRWHAHSLILAGIALACGFSAAMSGLLLFSPNTSLRSMLFWLSGDLNEAGLPLFGMGVLGVGFFMCLLLAPGLNILCRGEQQAAALGLAVRPYRIMLYLLSSLFTATAVSLAGCISFLGLIAPHLARRLARHDERIALPLAAILGGGLLCLADTAARTLLAPEQLPVGMVIAAIGVPTFIWMLQK